MLAVLVRDTMIVWPLAALLNVTVLRLPFKVRVKVFEVAQLIVVAFVVSVRPEAAGVRA